MPGQHELLTFLAAAVVAVVFVAVVRRRHQSRARESIEAADELVCEHLRPLLDLLRSRGHHITRVGQKHPDLPLEIHISPPFEPQVIYDELKLADPVFVSERRVIYCKQDWCEIDPRD